MPSPSIVNGGEQSGRGGAVMCGRCFAAGTAAEVADEGGGGAEEETAVALIVALAFGVVMALGIIEAGGATIARGGSLAPARSHATPPNATNATSSSATQTARRRSRGASTAAALSASVGAVGARTDAGAGTSLVVVLSPRSDFGASAESSVTSHKTSVLLGRAR